MGPGGLMHQIQERVSIEPRRDMLGRVPKNWRMECIVFAPAFQGLLHFSNVAHCQDVIVADLQFVHK